MSIRNITAGVVGGLVLLSGAALAQAPGSTAIDLNMRSGPGPHFGVIGVIPSGAPIAINGCAEDGSWCQVTHNGMQGWASSNYLMADYSGEQVIVAERRTEVNVPVVRYEDDAGTTAMGAATGAVAGALVAGPVGAAVGTAAGALLGEAADVPEPVVTYVREQRTEPVYLDGEVVVGATVPQNVPLQPVPDYDYSYTYVNGVPAVIEPSSRRVVYIVR